MGARLEEQGAQRGWLEAADQRQRSGYGQARGCRQYKPYGKAVQ